MTFRIKGVKHRHKVRFKARSMDGSASSQVDSSASSKLDELLYGNSGSLGTISGIILEEPADEEIWRDEDDEAMVSVAGDSPLIPDLFTTLPILRDILITETSSDQDETVQECLPYLNGTSDSYTAYNKYGLPHLDRARHIHFLHKSLGNLPAPYAASDAARPWFFYWALCALTALGEDVIQYRERLVGTIRPMQNSTGGFGGGHGQMSHLATSYAVVLSLCIVGGNDAMELIDRKAMWKWLSALKQPDGGFQMFVGGEEDMRGAYCAATIISLLNLPIELVSGSPGKLNDGDTLFTRLPEYISSCQSYEGGISNRPNLEAHGGYAFCALACLSIIGDPRVMIPKYLDFPRLLSWLSARQLAPEGGFAGRTNKLVDGCYAHWVGGCWPLIEACLTMDALSSAAEMEPLQRAHLGGPQTNWEANLYSREGLTRYILCCCQDTTRRGGLRDKPSKTSDPYHTCYVLAGLSSAQHNWYYGVANRDLYEGTDDLPFPYKWRMEKYPNSHQTYQIFDEVDRVNAVHPVFVVPETSAETMHLYFRNKGTF